MFKLKELKKTETVNKIIISILEDAKTYYKDYNVFDSKIPKYNNKFNTSFIFIISKVNEKKYNLKFRLLDNVIKNRHGKNCYYCGNNNGNLKYNCCDNTFHLSCGLINGFLCECSINKNILKKTNNKIECCVCLEDTGYKTKCNHPLCIECLEKIKKSYHKTYCPMCRGGLSILKKCNYNINIKIQNDDITCNILYFE